MLRLMALLEIREADCPPEVLANLVFSCLLVYNSAPESMPFSFRTIWMRRRNFTCDSW